MPPKIFGWEHLTYLAVFVVLSVAGLICAKIFSKTEKTQNIILKSVALALLISILVNRISIVFKTETPAWTFLIPDSYCGMSSLVLSLAVLLGKKDNNVLHFVWFMALLGGTITMFYPDFIGQHESLFYLPTISGLLHHSLSIVVVVMLFLFNQITVTYKKWYCTVFGFTAYITVGAFLMGVFNYSDAFHIISPMLSGTPLNTWVIMPIYAVVYGLILLGFELYRKHKNKTTEIADTTENKK